MLTIPAIWEVEVLSVKEFKQNSRPALLINEILIKKKKIGRWS